MSSKTQMSVGASYSSPPSLLQVVSMLAGVALVLDHCTFFLAISGVSYYSMALGSIQLCAQKPLPGGVGNGHLS